VCSAVADGSRIVDANFQPVARIAESGNLDARNRLRVTFWSQSYEPHDARITLPPESSSMPTEKTEASQDGKKLFDATRPYAEESRIKSWWSLGSTLVILGAVLVLAAVTALVVAASGCLDRVCGFQRRDVFHRAPLRRRLKVLKPMANRASDATTSSLMTALAPAFINAPMFPSSRHRTTNGAVWFSPRGDRTT
jgi:hypothetical protein